MRNPKIDIYVRKGDIFEYTRSTNMSKTCKEAKQRYYDYHYPSIAMADIKCVRAK